MYSIAQKKGRNYCNYFNYVLKLMGDDSDISAEYTYVPIGKVAEQIQIVFRKGQNFYHFKDFETIERKYMHSPDSTNMVVTLSDQKIGECTVTYYVKRDGISIFAETGNTGLVAEITGEAVLGKEDSVSSVCMDRI